MKRSAAITLLLLGAGCLDDDRGDAARRPECTIEADSDVDCIPPDGGHSEGTQAAYYHENGFSNAFLWYHLGTLNGSNSTARTVYVAPPAAYSPPPAPSTARAPFTPSSQALTARGGFGASGAAHGASGGGG